MSVRRSVLRNEICIKCHKEFTYAYSGGGVRKTCLKCKPAKTREIHNAYAKHNFDWGRPRHPWGMTQDGNIKRFVGKYTLVVHVDQDRFRMGFLLDGTSWENRTSIIDVSQSNIEQALAWSEKISQRILDSFEPE